MGTLHFQKTIILERQFLTKTSTTMKWYLKVLRHYTDFSGRARRTEYWMFVLFNLLFSIAAMVIDNLVGITFSFTNPTTGDLMPFFYGYVYLLYVLAVFLPGLAVLVRRLHDAGKSGWMFFICLIPIIGAIWLLVLLCTDSQSGSNKWGDNPKEIRPEDELLTPSR
jgi:uncharacterized membrane protein YhaH (DUF805 family)